MHEIFSKAISLRSFKVKNKDISDSGNFITHFTYLLFS